jgi:uncharacterized protein YbjT (DUF2867 family)
MGQGARAAIAGATGFVGRCLCAKLRDQGWEVVGLGRGVPDGATLDGVTWRRADLFSLLDCERALEGVEVLYYLVHSMMPSSGLTQARFEDMDLILADNMARAAARQGVRRIVYLGGLVPPDAGLSRHLASRREVEDALGAHGVPVTTLRAGLIVGPEGSSFQILARLVGRLPVMLLPRWTAARTQPIALDDVLELLVRVVAEGAAVGEAVDVGGPEVLSYRELIARTAAALGLKRVLIDLPVQTLTLSELWVSAVTGQPRQLTAPLVASLAHSMTARDRAVQLRLGVPGQGVDEAIGRAARGEAAVKGVRVPTGGPAPGGGRADRRVRSVQRMRLPPGRSAAWAAEAYLRWLPGALWPLLTVTEEGLARRIGLRGTRLCLLELTAAPERSTPDRALLYVTGGLLSRARPGDPRGRLELRAVLDGQTLVAAIHDFEPGLPWPVYLATQAQAHLLVMAGFRRHLRRLGGKGPEAADPARV